MPFTPPTGPARPGVVIFGSRHRPMPHGLRVVEGGVEPLGPLKMSDGGDWTVADFACDFGQLILLTPQDDED